jgi:hypothetical protein
MAQKTILQSLQGLPWGTFNPEEIIFLLWGIEIEFIYLVNEAKRLYSFTEKKAQGELYAEEFSFQGYNTFRGSRADFLSYFIFEEKRIDILGVEKKLARMLGYHKRYMKTLREEEYLSTFFTQRQVWVPILKKIHDQHGWEQLGFDFMKFHLEESIKLDEKEKKFENYALPKDFRIDEVFLHQYYGQQLILFEFLRT